MKGEGEDNKKGERTVVENKRREECRGRKEGEKKDKKNGKGEGIGKTVEEKRKSN